MLSKKLIKAAAGNAAPTEYQISRSLRFNSADSAYLNRTPASAGNRTTWTWSGWVKRSTLTSSTSRQVLFAAYGGNNNTDAFEVGFGATTPSASEIPDSIYTSVATQVANSGASKVFRDLSAWYHIVVSYDGSNVRVYVNNGEVLVWARTGNLGMNGAWIHAIGGSAGSVGTRLFNGYITEVNFIDGQALTPSDFGETDEITGVWKPKAYAGTYGTNGFYLNFSDNSGVTAATLGADSSGNGNNWTPNNFSVTANVNNDSLVDTPTPYGTDTGVGGEVRGNYATWNPLWAGASTTISNGNLRVVTPSSGTGRSVISTIAFDIASEKIYCEITMVGTGSTFGVIRIEEPDVVNYIGYTANGYAYSAISGLYNNSSATAYGATYTSGDIIGLAAGNGELIFYKNGVSQGTAISGLTGYFFVGVGALNMDLNVNFGQRPFAYTAPSGFKALCTQNLPTPTVVQGDDYFNTVLYTGTGSSQSITGVGFQPDFTWLKARSSAFTHGLIDAVRGSDYYLQSNSTAAESSGTTLTFLPDGFSLTTGFNNSGVTYVGWNWNAGGSNATNTDGTITSTVRANPTAGFSIVSWAGIGTAGNTNAQGTIGHGLGAIPKFIVVKSRTNTSNWIIYHDTVGPTKFLSFTTSAETVNANVWQNTAPDSSIVTLGHSIAVAGSGQNFIAYCFAEVEGFSKIGSYTGNGLADGPFVYCGFRPAFILVKNTTSGTAQNWQARDNLRPEYNVNSLVLFPNLSNAETTSTASSIDFLSNGFKLRGNSNDTNASTNTYIFMAFAESPFKYSLGR